MKRLLWICYAGYVIWISLDLYTKYTIRNTYSKQIKQETEKVVFIKGFNPKTWKEFEERK